MKKIFVLIVLCFMVQMNSYAGPSISNKFQKSPDPEASYYKGFFEYETLIQSRIGQDSDRIDLGKYVGASEVGNAPRSILRLLGVYESGASTIQNGEPNSLNFLLWTILIRGFVEDHLTICSSDLKFSKFLDPQYFQLIQQLCNNQNFTDVLLNELWIRIMGYDVPIEEYDDWLISVKSYLTEHPNSKNEPLEFALSLLFLNPYLLLK